MGNLLSDLQDLVVKNSTDLSNCKLVMQDVSDMLGDIKVKNPKQRRVAESVAEILYNL